MNTASPASNTLSHLKPVSHFTHSHTPTPQDGVLTVASGSTSLADMLKNSLEEPVIPKLQLTSEEPIASGQITMETREKSSAQTKKEDPKNQGDWHYHLGGMRHARTPLTPEIREVLEVAYVSRILAKSFRKEGQPEKERIARITGLSPEKVQEWFKNRRKKDKKLTSRQKNKLASMKQKSTDTSDYPITVEAVKTTEEWFKSRRRSSSLSKVAGECEGELAHALEDINPGFMEVTLRTQTYSNSAANDSAS